ncbi:MAG: septation protein SepH [Nakamurella sp.]
MREEIAMRTLRVLGLAEDGNNLVCEDRTSGELFTVPADERLRAAIRGDLSRLGQLEIELEPQLRPREIQARIRAGNSIAEVALAASTSVGRIERYAYPVLLERSTMAEKARQSHPMVDGNPTRKTLEELVLSTLSQRGQNTGVVWDAYKDDDGWVIAVRWHAGRSENQAHWDIHPAPRTNTVRARDDAARDLVEPSHHPLRTIAPSTAEASMADVARRITEAAQVAAVVEPELAQDFVPRAEQPETPSRHPAGTRRALSDRLEQEQMVEQTVLDERAGTQPAAQQKEPARTGTDHAPARAHRKGQRPVMPGWEDVLLGGGHTPGR